MSSRIPTLPPLYRADTVEGIVTQYADRKRYKYTTYLIVHDQDGRQIMRCPIWAAEQSTTPILQYQVTRAEIALELLPQSGTKYTVYVRAIRPAVTEEDKRRMQDAQFRALSIHNAGAHAMRRKNRWM